MRTHKLIIKPDGFMTCIYIDEIRPLIDNAEYAKTTRVSHVEPNDHGLWEADLSPIFGPRSPEFRLREEALAWEKSWIEANFLGTVTQ